MKNLLKLIKKINGRRRLILLGLPLLFILLLVLLIVTYSNSRPSPLESFPVAPRPRLTGTRTSTPTRTPTPRVTTTRTPTPTQTRIGAASGSPFWGGAQGTWSTNSQIAPVVEYRPVSQGAVQPRAVVFNGKLPFNTDAPYVAESNGTWTHTSNSNYFTATDAYAPYNGSTIGVIGHDSSGIALYNYNDVTGALSLAKSFGSTAYIGPKLHYGIVGWVVRSGNTNYIYYSLINSGGYWCNPQYVTGFTDTYTPSSNTVVYFDVNYEGSTLAETYYTMYYVRTQASGSSAVAKRITYSKVQSRYNCESAFSSVGDIGLTRFSPTAGVYNQAGAYKWQTLTSGYVAYIDMTRNNTLTAWGDGSNWIETDNVRDFSITNDGKYVVVRKLDESNTLWFSSQTGPFRQVTMNGQPFTLSTSFPVFSVATIESNNLQVVWGASGRSCSIVIPTSSGAITSVSCPSTPGPTTPPTNTPFLTPTPTRTPTPTSPVPSTPTPTPTSSTAYPYKLFLPIILHE